MRAFVKTAVLLAPTLATAFTASSPPHGDRHADDHNTFQPPIDRALAIVNIDLPRQGRSPNRDAAHVVALQIEVLPSEKACGYGNVTLGGQALSQTAIQVVTVDDVRLENLEPLDEETLSGRGAVVTTEGSVVVGSWSFHCGAPGRPVDSQLLEFKVDFVDGYAAEGSDFSILFRQTGSPRILDIGSGPTKHVDHASTEERRPEGDFESPPAQGHAEYSHGRHGMEDRPHGRHGEDDRPHRHHDGEERPHGRPEWADHRKDGKNRPGHYQEDQIEEHEQSVEDDITDLEWMKAQLHELEWLIIEKEQAIASRFNQDGHEHAYFHGINQCDSLKCLMEAAVTRARAAASRVYGTITGEDDRYDDDFPPPPPHHGQKPPRRGEGHVRPGKNHTGHGGPKHNHTSPHPPPGRRPYKPLPICRYPPPPFHHGHRPPPPPHHGDRGPKWDEHKPPPPPFHHGPQEGGERRPPPPHGRPEFDGPPRGGPDSDDQDRHGPPGRPDRPGREDSSDDLEAFPMKEADELDQPQDGPGHEKPPHFPGFGKPSHDGPGDDHKPSHLGQPPQDGFRPDEPRGGRDGDFPSHGPPDGDFAPHRHEHGDRPEHGGPGHHDGHPHDGPSNHGKISALLSALDSSPDEDHPPGPPPPGAGPPGRDMHKALRIVKFTAIGFLIAILLTALHRRTCNPEARQHRQRKREQHALGRFFSRWTGNVEPFEDYEDKRAMVMERTATMQPTQATVNVGEAVAERSISPSQDIVTLGDPMVGHSDSMYSDVPEAEDEEEALPAYEDNDGSEDSSFVADGFRYQPGSEYTPSHSSQGSVSDVLGPEKE